MLLHRRVRGGRARRWVAVVATLALGAVATWVPQASAQDDGSGSDGIVIEGDSSFTSLPRPNSGSEPQVPTDPGGWQQLLVLAVIVLALALVLWRVIAASRAAKASLD